MAKGHSGKGLHKTYAETGKVEEIPASSSTRFAEGGFVKHSNTIHTTKGAPRGYSHKVGKNKP